MAEKCDYAFRKIGDASLHCKLLEKEQFSQCAHQYYCKQTHRWEASDPAQKCPLPQKIKKSEK